MVISAILSKRLKLQYWRRCPATRLRIQAEVFAAQHGLTAALFTR
jgi:hypothetical protein